MKIIVTGAAGYIGSVMAAYLTEEGHEVIALDNLSRGSENAVPKGVRFIKADIRDLDTVVTAKDNVEAIVHLAAYAYVGESVEKPELYWENNVVGTLGLLRGMRNLGIKKLVFASTCATYGEPETVPITENESTKPVNAYGMTKLAIDMAIASESRAHGLAATSLRFFNVAGAYKEYGEQHSPETHIIPLALDVASGKRSQFSLFGDDYETPDGSCVRNYIHVADLALAAKLALEKLAPSIHSIYNLGSGNGFSNREVVKVTEAVTGKVIPLNVEERRPGDPPKLVAASEKVKKELGWEPKYPALEQMIGDAWRFHQVTRR